MIQSRLIVLPFLVSVACVLVSAPLSAQVDLGAFGRSLASQAQFPQTANIRQLPAVFARGRSGGVPLIVHAPAGGVSAAGLTTLGDFALGELEPGQLVQ